MDKIMDIACDNIICTFDLPVGGHVELNSKVGPEIIDIITEANAEERKQFDAMAAYIVADTETEAADALTCLHLIKNTGSTAEWQDWLIEAAQRYEDSQP